MMEQQWTEQDMEQWTCTPGTLEAAVAALPPDEVEIGLQILSKVKCNIYAYAEETNVKPYEWDGQTATNILDAFDYVERRRDSMTEQERAATLEAITARINRLDREGLAQLHKFLNQLEEESEG